MLRGGRRTSRCRVSAHTTCGGERNLPAASAREGIQHLVPLGREASQARTAEAPSFQWGRTVINRTARILLCSTSEAGGSGLGMTGRGAGGGSGGGLGRGLGSGGSKSSGGLTPRAFGCFCPTSSPCCSADSSAPGAGSAAADARAAAPPAGAAEAASTACSDCISHSRGGGGGIGSPGRTCCTSGCCTASADGDGSGSGNGSGSGGAGQARACACKWSA